MKRKSDLALDKNLLRSLDFIIRNPVLETPEDVRALKRIRNRLKKAKAIKKMTL
jgi:hypothetical protein